MNQVKTKEVSAVVAIERGGDKIMLPVNMTYKTGREWLTRAEEAEEQPVTITEKLIGYPLDGLVALKRAAEAIYGFYEVGSRGWWGNLLPANLITVPLWGGESVQVPYEPITIPTWEGAQIQPVIAPEMSLTLRTTVKRKFEAEVNRLFAEAKQQLKDNSIYKGKAISVKLDFLTGNEEFHPVNSAPTFMNEVVNTKETDIILNDVTEFEVQNDIYAFIERTSALKKNHVPLRHGVVLASTFGMGKTLLSQIIAGKAVANDWTFIYLEKIDQIAIALKFAQTYAPSIIFGEDIDQVVSGERNSKINDILNTVDGIDTKGKAVITILTTNNVESIEPAFLRAGRVNSLITLDKPDANTAIRFVHLYAAEALSEDANLTEVSYILAGMTPAFISEAVQKAKRHALYRIEGDDITGQVTSDDLLKAAKSMAKHIALSEQKKGQTPAERVVEAMRIETAARNSVYEWAIPKNGANDRLSTNLANMKSH